MRLIKNIKLIIIITLFIFSQLPLKGQVLNVPQVIQEENQWCWAAASKCILDYKGFNFSQCQIAEYTRTVAQWHSYGNVNCCTSPGGACNYGDYTGGYAGSVQDILEHFGGLTNYTTGALSIPDINKSISQNLPFVMYLSAGGGHIIVGHGIADSSLYIMNPWPGEGFGIANYSSSLSNWIGTNVIVPPTFTIKGLINYDNVSNTPIKYAKVILRDSEKNIIDTCITDSIGNYSLSGILNGKYTINIIQNYIWGGVNTVDALLCMRNYINIFTFKDSLSMKAADLNIDNRINPTDALIINKRYVNLINSFPAGDWIVGDNSVVVDSKDIVKNIKMICAGDIDASYKPVYLYKTCGDYFTDTRDGQAYKTVQIGTQCWMAQNINIGSIISGISDQTDNGVIEKYCYKDSVKYCNAYGGLYQWNETMQYATTESSQGICPSGWHIPSNNECFILENYLDPDVNDPNAIGWLGTVAGTKLLPGGTSGFNALTAGSRIYDGTYLYSGSSTFFWSSTGNPSAFAYGFSLDANNPAVFNCIWGPPFGQSVRCLKD